MKDEEGEQTALTHTHTHTHTHTFADYSFRLLKPHSSLITGLNLNPFGRH